jgi:hypothetical protein
MKKRKPAMESVTISREFLRDLLAPFHPMEKIYDVVYDGTPGIDKVIVYYKKGGVENNS